MWKQRLYAFLLRRVLGPLLDDESLSKLHKRIDSISVFDGTLTLRDIGLNTQYLSQRVGASVKQATIERLEIALSILEHGDNNSSFVWRAVQLGTGSNRDTTATASDDAPDVSSINTASAVSLVANLQLDGLEVHVVLDDPPTASDAPTQSTPSAAKSRLAAYLDAALKSLKLSVQLQNTVLRVISPVDETAESPKGQPWLEMRSKSLSYLDVADASISSLSHVEDATSSVANETANSTLFSKSLSIAKLTVLTGRDDIVRPSTIALLSGSNQIRIIATNSQHLHQDVQVQMSQQCNISLDRNSLLCTQKVIEGLGHWRRRRSSLGESSNAQEEPLPSHAQTTREELEHEEDLKVLDGIMKQYDEARHLAEQNAVRGGILVPTDPDEDGNVSFDAFFDANEQGFDNYSTILQESTTLELETDDADLVHTSVRVRLAQGGIKFAFNSMQQQESSRIVRRPDEYLLLTFSELSVDSSLSLNNQQHTLTLGQLDIEDSQIETTGPDGSLVGRRVEIGRVLAMKPINSKSGGDRSNVLIQPPCISASIATSKVAGIASTDVALDFSPMEVTYRHRTMSNLAREIESMRSVYASAKSSKRSVDVAQRNLSVLVSCPAMTAMLPVAAEMDCSPLYERFGYSDELHWSTRSALIITLSQLRVQSSEDESEPRLFVSVSHAVFSASSPTGTNMASRGVRRLDIMCFTGPAEIDTTIPITLKLWRHRPAASEEVDSETVNHAVRSFPKVQAISSFKARQEDDDDDNQIDRVLLSELGDSTSSKVSTKYKDPQQDMLAEARDSDQVLEILVPEIVADVTPLELSVLSAMLDYVHPSDPLQDERIHGGRSESGRTSIVLACKSFSLAVNGDGPSAEPNADVLPATSFFLYAWDMKVHVLRDGSSLRQLRLLVDDIDAYEVEQTSRIQLPRSVHSNLSHRFRAGSGSVEPGLEPTPTDGPIDLLLRRVHVAEQPGRSVTPLIHRSHLFLPISRQSPVFIFDLVHHVRDQECPDRDSVHRSLHATLYDLTYRYDCESPWITSLLALFRGTEQGPGVESRRGIDRSSVARVFLNVADCNIDYCSSKRFKTPSRAIVRVGDLRVSSNVVWPKPKAQAFRVAFGDVSFHLCRTRYPYNFENSRIRSSVFMMQQDEISMQPLMLKNEATCDNVQRSMGLLTVVMLDSFDSVVILSRNESVSTPEPRLKLSLTVGELCIFVCKDSFEHLCHTTSELTSALTALDEKALDELKAKSVYTTETADDDTEKVEAKDVKYYALEDLKRRSALRPTAGTAGVNGGTSDFLLDGYDWTTIDQDASSVANEIPPGEEQSARWYGDERERRSMTADEEVAFMPTFKSSVAPAVSKISTGPKIITHHFPLQPVHDPLGDTDTALAKYAGMQTTPPIQSRLLIHNFSFRFRCFDGYDWPEEVHARQRVCVAKKCFVIEESLEELSERKREATKNIAERIEEGSDVYRLGRRAALMGDLLAGNEASEDTFRDLPLPEERGAELKEQAELNRLARRAGKYFQISAIGITARMDSLADSNEHRLASCLNLKADDFFIAETISSDRPVKVAGEWVSESDHPRDTKLGIIMMKMVTWHPTMRVTPNNEIVNDESDAVVKILPLRCNLDQRALRFARSFFRSDNSRDANETATLQPRSYTVPPPLFTSFRFKPFKLKVDYRPEKIDTRALRDGAFVELVNLSPLDGMVLTLQPVEIELVVGFGEVISIAVKRWIEDICATQIFKFLTNARPFEPFSHVGGRAADMVVLPWDAIKNGESIRSALRAGAFSFSNALAYETINVTSRAAQFLADQVARVSASGTGGNNVLPSRPLEAPSGLLDTAPHVLESISRGLQAANYKLVIVPYREYRRSGATGAATSVLKGIPVAIAAPASGTAEAISFALLGARNRIHPEVRKEEEESQRGLHLDG